VLWEPGTYSLVLQLLAFPGGSISETDRFDLSRIPGLRWSLRTSDGCNHILYQYGKDFLQLSIRGADLSKPVHLLTAALIASDDFKAPLDALGIFNYLWRGRTIPHLLLPATPNGDRLRFVVRALDGRLAGASYREIAVGLFGAARVRSNWSDDDDHLKNRTRRAVQRGKMLTAGGYRYLLSSHPSNRYTKVL